MERNHDGGKQRRVPPQSTPEQRARAQAARRASIQAGKRFRQDFLEAPRWTRLATAAGRRLPAWHIAPTPRRLALTFTLLLRAKQGSETPVKAGQPGTFADLFGCTPARLIALNPDWPLRALVGLMLEALAA